MNQIRKNEAYDEVLNELSERIAVLQTKETRSVNKNQVPLSEKFLLTVKEASIYFNIGENKMHRIAAEYLESDHRFVIQNGGRTMINRKKFEDFLNNSTSI